MSGDGNKLRALTVQDRPPNFREGGRLYLVRCFACNPKHGRENWMPAVARGYCEWCGWNERLAAVGRALDGNKEPV